MPPGPAGFFVSEYVTRMNLSKMGYKFDPDDLDPIEVEALLVVHTKYSNLLSLEMKNKKGKGKKGR